MGTQHRQAPAPLPLPSAAARGAKKVSEKEYKEFSEVPDDSKIQGVKVKMGLKGGKPEGSQQPEDEFAM